MDMQENKFRQNLKSLRLERKMSQSQLASLIGVSQQCVSEWESGNNEPSLSSLLKLSDVLEITIDELVGKS
jgi:transcriptional regulator with XRE-family HTH domain